MNDKIYIAECFCGQINKRESLSVPSGGLCDHCRGKLSNWKLIPRKAIDLMESAPRNR